MPCLFLSRVDALFWAINGFGSLCGLVAIPHQSNSSQLNCPFVMLDAHFQVIALNGSLAAEGELYIDDGKSYDFKKGAYIHRRFVFSDGKLISSNIAPTNSGKQPYSSNCVIERIILLGLPSGAKGALVEPANYRTDIEPGTLTLRGGSSPVARVIRKPNVRITDDWTIKIL